MDQDISIPPTPIDVLENNDAPQKYIRTYARDMATVQKGGTPDLVPLRPVAAPTHQSTPEGIPEVPFTPSAAPAPTPAALPVPITVTVITPAPEVSTTPPPAPIEPPPPPRETPKEAVVTTYDEGF